MDEVSPGKLLWQNEFVSTLNIGPLLQTLQDFLLHFSLLYQLVSFYSNYTVKVSKHLPVSTVIRYRGTGQDRTDTTHTHTTHTHTQHTHTRNIDRSSSYLIEHFSSLIAHHSHYHHEQRHNFRFIVVAVSLFNGPSDVAGPLQTIGGECHLFGITAF